MKTKEENQRRFEEIQKHYEAACKKHPVFAHRMDRPVAYNESHTLKSIRDRRAREKQCTPKDVLNAEYAEIVEAYVNGNHEHAIYECYDCIAVVLRIVDFLERVDILERVGGTNA